MNKMVLKPNEKLQTKFFVILVVAAVLLVAGTYLMVWFLAKDARADNPGNIGFLAAGLGNGVWILPAVLLIPAYCRSLVYEIRADEVVVRVGIITKSVKHVPYRTVTNLQVMQGPFDRLFGLGTLNIQTAGMSGQQGAEESLVGLSNHQEVYEMIAESLRQFRSAMAPTQTEDEDVAAAPAPAATPVVVQAPDNSEVIALMKGILQELKVIRENVQL